MSDVWRGEGPAGVYIVEVLKYHQYKSLSCAINDYLSVIITEEISVSARTINVPEFFIREMEPLAGAFQQEGSSQRLCCIFLTELVSQILKILNNDQHSRNV